MDDHALMSFGLDSFDPGGGPDRRANLRAIVIDGMQSRARRRKSFVELERQMGLGDNFTKLGAVRTIPGHDGIEFPQAL